MEAKSVKKYGSPKSPEVTHITYTDDDLYELIGTLKNLVRHIERTPPWTDGKAYVSCARAQLKKLLKIAPEYSGFVNQEFNMDS